LKFAALVTESVNIPGDERSRTNPGHGYPASTMDYIRVVEFKSEVEMEEWVKKETTKPYGGSPARFRLIQYEELKYTTTVKVEVQKVKP